MGTFEARPPRPGERAGNVRGRRRAARRIRRRTKRIETKINGYARLLRVRPGVHPTRGRNSHTLSFPVSVLVERSRPSIGHLCSAPSAPLPSLRRGTYV